jgi:hypothetical protein
MTLTIELPPEMEQRLEEEAARLGKAPAEFVRAVVEEKLAASPAAGRESVRQRNQAALALLRQWRKEDAVDPDPSPVPNIPPLSLRKVKID